MTYFSAFRAYSLEFVVSTLLSGCLEHSADLGNSPAYDPVYAEAPPPATPAAATLPLAAPWKLVEHESYISGFAVDQGQAFWFNQLFGGSRIDRISQLNRCDVAGCKSTLMQVGVWDVPAENIFASNFTVVNSDVLLTFPTGKLAACSRSSCNDPTLFLDGLTDNAQLSFTGVVASDNESILCSFGPQIIPASYYYCKTADCNGTIVKLPVPAAFDGSQGAIYDLVIDSEFAYAGEETGIYRLKLDGTTNWELIAANVGRIARLALHGDSIYWTEPVTLGTVKTCPKTGCIGTPAVVVPKLNRPTALIMDDNYVYVMEPAFRHETEYGDRILRCPIGGCDEPTVLAKNVGCWSGFSQDQSYIYFSGAENYCFDSEGVNQCRLQPIENVSPRDNSFYIAAIAK